MAPARATATIDAGEWRVGTCPVISTIYTT
jgi:hypothetical protein